MIFSIQTRRREGGKKNCNNNNYKYFWTTRKHRLLKCKRYVWMAPMLLWWQRRYIPNYKGSFLISFQVLIQLLLLFLCSYISLDSLLTLLPHTFKIMKEIIVFYSIFHAWEIYIGGVWDSGKSLALKRSSWTPLCHFDNLEGQHEQPGDSGKSLALKRFPWTTLCHFDNLGGFKSIITQSIFFRFIKRSSGTSLSICIKS